MKGKNDVVCEVLSKSQHEDKGDPVDNPLNGIQICCSKGSHGNLAVGGLEGRALCIRIRGKKGGNIYIYVYIYTYIILISQWKEAASRSVLFHTDLSDL